MDAVAASSERRINPLVILIGFILTCVVGAVAAGISGFAYFYVAIQLEIDIILVEAMLFGAAVGFVVGMAARMTRLRLTVLVVLLGFVFAIAGYAGRYYFEFNDFVTTIVNEAAPADLTPGEARQSFLEFWDQAYPPGGFLGYMRYVAETGFTVGDQISFDPETNTTTRGTQTEGAMAWLLFILETVFTGVFGAIGARVATAPPAR